MKDPDQHRNAPDRPRTLGEHFRRAVRARRSWRPASFYLLLAIPVVLILAVPVFYTRDNPKKFALHLSLVFVFIFVVVLCAVVDVIEISRRHFAERRDAWQKTLGEEEFVHKLGDRPNQDPEE